MFSMFGKFSFETSSGEILNLQVDLSPPPATPSTRTVAPIPTKYLRIIFQENIQISHSILTETEEITRSGALHALVVLTIIVITRIIRTCSVLSHLSLPARSTVLRQGPTSNKKGKGHYTGRGRGRGGRHVCESKL